MEKTKREVSIDILKCIGLLLIILAHCSAPTFIDEIRNFDVVLLVILSGVLAENHMKEVEVDLNT